MTSLGHDPIPYIGKETQVIRVSFVQIKAAQTGATSQVVFFLYTEKS
ncbi:MAG: hypothetical protein KAH24_06125 [Holophagae bacterium]|nr:hypothetical protein [Holophagae bacterium]